jgi:DNA polymerase-4
MFVSRSHAVAEAMDKINDKYGEFVITPALLMGMDDTIIDRIAFGGSRSWRSYINSKPLSTPLF